MTYVVVSYTGQLFPLASCLQDEGGRIVTCQIRDPKELGVTSSWVAEKETPERRRRRLSLYDGCLDKCGLEGLFRVLRDLDPEETLIICEHNALWRVADRIRKLGFRRGLLPTREDFDREQDREATKAFVDKDYPGLLVAKVERVGSVDEAVEFLWGSPEVWVAKSDGNFGETVIPPSDDPDLAREQVCYQLEEQRKEYDKGGLILERKIPNAIEFTPVMAFWDGVPAYSLVEIETRWLGAEDSGPQTGGNQNLLVQTNLDDPINDIAFPPAIRALATRHAGLFLADAGILSDGDDLYFTEMAGNRYGYGGIFAELSAAWSRGRMAVPYFEALAAGENPLRFAYAACVAFYNLHPDEKFPGLWDDGIPVFASDEAERNLFLFQAKADRRGRWVTVGLDPDAVGYAVGRGETIRQAANSVYRHLDGVSMKDRFRRPKSDFLAEDYPSAVLNRVKFLTDQDLVRPWRGVQEKAE